jgi:hypothetical protein
MNKCYHVFNSSANIRVDLRPRCLLFDTTTKMTLLDHSRQSSLFNWRRTAEDGDVKTQLTQPHDGEGLAPVDEGTTSWFHTSFENWYPGEQRLLRLPVFRTVMFLASLLALLGGISFVDGLCTRGMKGVFGTALAFAMLALFWSIVADTPTPFPGTWTFQKRNGVHPSFCAIYCFYQATLIGITVSLICITFAFNFVDMDDFFKWDCDTGSSSGRWQNHH